MPFFTNSGNAWLGQGTRFVKGDEIPQNVILGYACFRIGASLDSRGAIENLGLLSPHLTEVQRREGDQIAARLFAGEPVPLATAADGLWQKPTLEDVKYFFAPIREAGRALSVSDLSTLEALIDTPTASLLTSQGSPLDELFRSLMHVGWALRKQVAAAPSTENAKSKPGSFASLFSSTKRKQRDLMRELDESARRYTLSNAGQENGKGLLKILVGDYSDRSREA